MEFLNYKVIKTKQNRRGILYKKPNPEEISSQYYALARELEDHNYYSGLCHLAVNSCIDKGSQVGAYLNAARSFSKADSEIISTEDHVQSVKWVYKEALSICDSSYLAPINLELGRYYETKKMHLQAAECFKHSMSISRCVLNLLQSKLYKNALEELKNYPSHLLSLKDHTTMFLLELLVTEDPEGLPKKANSDIDDLSGLLESLSMAYRPFLDNQQTSPKNEKIKKIIVDRLSAFLDQAQMQLLFLLYDKAKCNKA